MDNNEFKNQSTNNEIYRATSNLNTALEDPKIVMNSAVDMNIKNTDYSQNNVSSMNYDSYSNNIQSSNDIYNPSNYIKNDFENNNQNQFINNNYQEMSNQNEFIPNNNFDNNQFVNNSSFVDSRYDNIISNTSTVSSYQPILEEKKEHSEFAISREFKLMLFIVLLLLIFVFMLPDIFDFISKLQSSIAT